MNELIGRKVTDLYVSEDDSILVFETDKGEVSYEAEGDCCSRSWFADILGVAALIGHTVNGVEDVKLDDLPAFATNETRTRQQYDQIYGHKLTTEAGYVDIVYRNSSNGYYGGWLSKRSQEGHKGMRQITQDWSAS